MAEGVLKLLEGVAEVCRTSIEGQTLLQWCDEKGFDDAAKLIRSSPEQSRLSRRRDR
ncbi:MAG: hypothetical protein O3B13_13220 [Planctomycetota bacterium]|nr:hypothetical protein [Planctomycetota bacterium]MDA1164060.1 hypothetical protein [Planctomycetota bacterium]